MDQIDRFRRVPHILAVNRQVHRRNQLRRERVFRDRMNPFYWFSDEGDFIDRFRFTKGTVQYIIELVAHDIGPHTARSHAVPAFLQVLIALEFYASGTFQITVVDIIHVHQSTVRRIVKRVSIALARKKHMFIRLPRGREVQRVREQFYQIANFPQVVAAIDCTHLAISNPGGEDSQRVINRKGWHSLNCQFTCDANMIISSVVARWHGSAHDSRIFNESQLKACFETGQHQGVLVGDGGYAALPYMLTPLNRPQTGPDRAYNLAHARTRGA